METTEELLALALSHIQAGQNAQAEQIYRRVLEVAPENFAALHFAGVLAHQRGDNARALVDITKAISLHPDNATFHNNLGVVYQAQGQLNEAIASFREAIRLQPDNPEAHNNLGKSMSDQGLLEESIACYRLALRLRPTFPEALHNLGFALAARGQFEAAAHCYRQAIANKPDYHKAHYQLAEVFRKQSQWPEAAASYRQALSLRPENARAHRGLGDALFNLHRTEEAIASYREALRLFPDFVEAQNGLGIALLDQGRLDEAHACFRHVLQLRPGDPEPYNNLGLVFLEQARLDEAIASFQEAIRLRPDDPTHHSNLSHPLLMQARWEEGWLEYEWRTRAGDYPRLLGPQPRWDGAPLEGRTILLHTEQGLGDTFQFVRFAEQVKQRGGRVLLRCEPVQTSLLARSPGIDQVISAGDPVPDFDVFASLMSLPGILRTRSDNVPAKLPYLFAQSQLQAKWRQEIAGLTAGLRVGIVWQGNPKSPGDLKRSISLDLFEPLAGVQGIRLISLQVGAGREQLAAVGARWPIVDLGERFDPSTFEDMAAVMTNLDLVITVESAAAHLAGGLGVPVWVPLCFAKDWRWLLEREDTFWYPSMRLFRQKQSGQWREVFARVAEEVRRLI